MSFADPIPLVDPSNRRSPIVLSTLDDRTDHRRPAIGAADPQEAPAVSSFVDRHR